MKILIVGNHACANRGDSAILRGLICYLEARGATNYTITSRYPVSSQYLLGKPIISDPLDAHYRQLSGLKGKVIGALQKRLTAPLLYLTGRNHGMSRLLPAHFRRYLDYVNQFDLVIQVGGSFFVDLYGPAQFEHAAAAYHLKKPFILAGHSLGPFKTRLSQFLAQKLLAHAVTVLRDDTSKVELPLTADDNLINGADTAWLIDTEQSFSDYIQPVQFKANEKTVAITVRNLKPFDRRLGITQEAYEIAVAKLADRLIEAGYNILFASTCTGIDNYNKDDRVIALKIQARMENPATVVMDELSDHRLGQLLGQCGLIIGTRLHSAILATRYGTPAMTIFYEHKSLGVMKALGREDWCIKIQDIAKNETYDKAIEILTSKKRNETRDLGDAQSNIATQALDKALKLALPL